MDVVEVPANKFSLWPEGTKKLWDNTPPKVSERDRRFSHLPKVASTLSIMTLAGVTIHVYLPAFKARTSDEVLPPPAASAREWQEPPDQDFPANRLAIGDVYYLLCINKKRDQMEMNFGYALPEALRSLLTKYTTVWWDLALPKLALKNLCYNINEEILQKYRMNGLNEWFQRIADTICRRIQIATPEPRLSYALDFVASLDAKAVTVLQRMQYQDPMAVGVLLANPEATAPDVMSTAGRLQGFQSLNEGLAGVYLVLCFCTSFGPSHTMDQIHSEVETSFRRFVFSRRDHFRRNVVQKGNDLDHPSALVEKSNSAVASYTWRELRRLAKTALGKEAKDTKSLTEMTVERYMCRFSYILLPYSLGLTRTVFEEIPDPCGLTRFLLRFPAVLLGNYVGKNFAYTKAMAELRNYLNLDDAEMLEQLRALNAIREERAARTNALTELRRTNEEELIAHRDSQQAAGIARLTERERQQHAYQERLATTLDRQAITIKNLCVYLYEQVRQTCEVSGIANLAIREILKLGLGITTEKGQIDLRTQCSQLGYGVYNRIAPMTQELMNLERTMRLNANALRDLGTEANIKLTDANPVPAGEAIALLGATTTIFRSLLVERFPCPTFTDCPMTFAQRACSSLYEHKPVVFALATQPPSQGEMEAGFVHLNLPSIHEQYNKFNKEIERNWNRFGLLETQTNATEMELTMGNIRQAIEEAAGDDVVFLSQSFAQMPITSQQIKQEPMVESEHSTIVQAHEEMDTAVDPADTPQTST